MRFREKVEERERELRYLNNEQSIDAVGRKWNRKAAVPVDQYAIMYLFTTFAIHQKWDGGGCRVWVRNTNMDMKQVASSNLRTLVQSPIAIV